jgi:hypothetical protein
MKEWPEDEEPVNDLEEILRPLFEVFEKVYDTDVEIRMLKFRRTLTTTDTITISSIFFSRPSDI